jgi:hypothetical protein
MRIRRRRVLELPSTAIGLLAFLALLALLALLVCAAGACSTDTGSQHGPAFGDLPPDDGPTDGGREARARLPDGAPAPGDDDDSAPPGPSCASGTLAILAGDDGQLSAAIQTRGGAWSVSSIQGGAAKSKPALVAVGGAFLGVTDGAGDALQWTRWSAGTWTNAASTGNAGVKGAPSLAVAGTKAHVVYSAGPNANRDYAHGVYDGTSFDGATDPVGPPLSFGTVSAGLTAVGSSIVFLENGSDHGLYGRQYDGTWSASSAVFGAGSVGSDPPATPEIVNVSGAFDVVAVYAEKDTKILSYATRDGTSHAWAAPLDAAHQIDPLAQTAEKFALALINPTTLALAFRSQDGKGFVSTGTIGASSVTWTQASPVGGGGTAPDVDSTPAVAKGVCGDDAALVYASGGAVRVTRLRGGAWQPAETIGNLGGSRVAIASE